MNEGVAETTMMKLPKLLLILSITVSIIVTAINLEFLVDVGPSLHHALWSSLYIAIWAGLATYSIKNKHTSYLVYTLIFWGLTALACVNLIFDDFIFSSIGLFICLVLLPLHLSAYALDYFTNGLTVLLILAIGFTVVNIMVI